MLRGCNVPRETSDVTTVRAIKTPATYTQLQRLLKTAATPVESSCLKELELQTAESHFS